MCESFEYVKAKKEDIATLAAFRVAMFMDMFPDKDWGALAADLTEASTEYYGRRSESPDDYSCIARVEGKSVGSGCIMFQERTPHISRLRNLCGYILSIAGKRLYERLGFVAKETYLEMEL
jgi:hypothetical protein